MRLPPLSPSVDDMQWNRSGWRLPPPKSSYGTTILSCKKEEEKETKDWEHLDERQGREP